MPESVKQKATEYEEKGFQCKLPQEEWIRNWDGWVQRKIGKSIYVSTKREWTDNKMTEISTERTDRNTNIFYKKFKGHNKLYKDNFAGVKNKEG